MKPEPSLDFRPLIELLEKLEAQRSRQEQEAALALELASMTIDPDCYRSVVIRTTLDHLATVGTAELRQWEPGRENLGGFFTAGNA